MSNPQDLDGGPRAGAAGPPPQASRQRVLRGARKVFIERGYHDTRPRNIPRAAGVGHGTFYLHS